MQVKIEIEEKVEKKFRKNWKIVEKKLRKVEEEKLKMFVINLKKNIARGTTDPGYWVRNLNDLFSQYDFKLISVRNMIQAIDSIPWVRCASGNVFVEILIWIW